MLEALSKTNFSRLMPFVCGAALAVPFFLLATGSLQGFSTAAAAAFAGGNGLLFALLFAFLAGKSANRHRSREGKYLSIVRLAFFPWLIASIGVAIASIDLAKPAEENALHFLQYDVALNFCLSLTLFVLFASMQVKERERHPINFQHWLAPLILFFVLGILQFLNFRHGTFLNSFSTVAGVSVLVAGLNAAIAWQLSSAFSQRSRLFFMLAIGLQLAAHFCVLSRPADNMAIFVFRQMTATVAIGLLFAFHCTLSLIGDEKPLPVKRSKQKMGEDFVRPLQTVMAYSEVLQDELAQSLQFNASLEMEKINHAAAQMLSMIDPQQRAAMQDMPESRSFDGERFMQVLQRMAERMALPFGTRVQAFCPRGFGVIQGDEAKLLHICASTLDYVLRSGRQSRICLHLYPLQKGGQDYINIDIRGVGPGLDKNLSRVLEAGFASKLNLYSPEASPLGLLRIKENCEEIGVQFWLESCEGRGATFSIAFRDHIARNGFLCKDERSSSILLIDDDNRAEKIIKDIVNASELDLVRVSQIRSGLRVFYEKQPEIVITDLTIPSLQGLNFIESVRAKKADCFIISLIKKEVPQLREQALSLGVDLLLEKPLSLEGLSKGLGSLHTVIKRTA